MNRRRQARRKPKIATTSQRPPQPAPTGPPPEELWVSDPKALARLAELSREERLRLVLNFVAENLEALTDPDRVERLRTLFTILRPRRVMSPSGPIVWESETAPAMTDANLDGLQRLQWQLRDGIRDFVRPGTAWALPAPGAAFLARERISYQLLGEPPRPAEWGGARWAWVTTWSVMIVAGVADLVWEHVDRVRACKVCDVLFLATKRQEYCTPEHGQRARDERRGRGKGGRR